MKSYIIAAALALPLFAQPIQAGKLVQVVIDHSGVLHDEQDPMGKTGFNSFVAAFLADIARQNRRDRNQTQVVLISAVEPVHILWSGTAAAFYRDGVRGPVVEGLIAAQPNGCNNLVDAMAEVSANVQISDAEETIVHIITSGVHSGPDCADLTQEQYVQLVETVDPALGEQLEALATEVDQLALHYLTATLRRGFLSSMNWRDAGITLSAQGEGSGL